MPRVTTENAELAIAFVCVLWALLVFSPLRWTVRRLTWTRFLPRDAEMRDNLLAVRARAAFTAGRRPLAHALCARHTLGKWIYKGLQRDATPEKAQTDDELRRAMADDLRMRAIGALNEGDKATYQKLWHEADRQRSGILFDDLTAPPSLPPDVANK